MTRISPPGSVYLAEFGEGTDDLGFMRARGSTVDDQVFEILTESRCKAVFEERDRPIFVGLGEDIREITRSIRSSIVRG